VLSPLFANNSQSQLEQFAEAMISPGIQSHETFPPFAPEPQPRLARRLYKPRLMDGAIYHKPTLDEVNGVIYRKPAPDRGDEGTCEPFFSHKV